MSETQRVYWTCRHNGSHGGSEANRADADDAKATHEIVCPQNPVQPGDHPKGGGRR